MNNKSKLRLLSFIGILAGIIIITLKRVLENRVGISDFMSGFCDGFSVTLILILLIVLITTTKRNK